MEKYVIDFSKLNVGDIILTKEKKILSKAIRIATKGDYSHAMIVFRGGSAIEADKRGVNSTVINRHIFNLKSRLFLYLLRLFDFKCLEDIFLKPRQWKKDSGSTDLLYTYSG